MAFINSASLQADISAGYGSGVINGRNSGIQFAASTEFRAEDCDTVFTTKLYPRGGLVQFTIDNFPLVELNGTPIQAFTSEVIELAAVKMLMIKVYTNDVNLAIQGHVTVEWTDCSGFSGTLVTTEGANQAFGTKGVLPVSPLTKIITTFSSLNANLAVELTLLGKSIAPLYTS